MCLHSPHSETLGRHICLLPFIYVEANWQSQKCARWWVWWVRYGLWRFTGLFERRKNWRRSINRLFALFAFVILRSSVMWFWDRNVVDGNYVWKINILISWMLWPGIANLLKFSKNSNISFVCAEWDHMKGRMHTCSRYEILVGGGGVWLTGNFDKKG